MLVAAQDRCIDREMVTGRPASTLSARELKSDQSNYRMTMSRVRDHLHRDAVVEGDDGYRLALPTDRVDAWWLLDLGTSAAPLDDTTPGELVHLLNPAPPFGGVEGIDMVDRMARRILSSQRALLGRLGRERPDLLQGELLELLREHLDADPFNERLLGLLVVAEAQAGNRRRALELLRQADEEFAEIGLSLSPEVQQLELSLLNADPTAAPRLVPYVPADRLQLPGLLAGTRTTPHVGHTAEVDTIIDHLDHDGFRAVVVSGAWGSGTTRLCAEVAARRASQGIPTLYLAAAQVGEATPFGPLQAALPHFLERSTGIFAAGHSHQIQQAELLLAAIDAIRTKAGGGRLLIVVDDSHQLDSQTVELIGRLPHSALATQLEVLVVTDEHPAPPASPGWVPLATAISRLAGATRVSLDPLDQAAVRRLVLAHYATNARHLLADRRLAENVSREVHTLSGGVAAVVQLLLSNLDELGMVPNLESLPGDRVIESLAGAMLDPAVMATAQVAAVVGPAFELAALEHVSGLDPAVLLDHLDLLMERDLIRQRALSRYELANVVIQSALVATIEADRLRRHHQAAAAFYHGDVHRRAHHQAKAGYLVDEATVLASLLSSARLHLERGAYQEAVGAYRQAALTRGRTGLEPEDGGRFARALELSGLPAGGRRVRAEAFEAALNQGDHTLALTVAVSGLPETEPVDGDPVLIELLGRVDPDRLAPAAAHALASHLARQHTIAGSVETAVAAAHRAAELASTPDEEATAAIGLWFAVSADANPQERLRILDRVPQPLDEVSPGPRAHYCLLRALGHYEAGELDQSQVWRERMDAVPGPLIPLRRWHQRLFDAMVAFDAGQRRSAHAQLHDAAAFALQAGIGEGLNARILAEFVDRWLAGDLHHYERYLDQGDLLSPDAGMVLARAAAIVISDTVGRDQAQIDDQALRLVAEVLASPAPHGAGVLALVAPVLARTGHTELISQAAETLARRGSSLLVVGACVASLGPVDRYLAQLADNETLARHHRLQAVKAADAGGSLLWRVVTRRDLIEAGVAADGEGAEGAEGAEADEVGGTFAADLPDLLAQGDLSYLVDITTQ